MTSQNMTFNNSASSSENNTRFGHKSATQSIKEYRIVLFGSPGVGKTAIVSQFMSNYFCEKYEATIEDTYRKTIFVDGKIYSLNIIDTSGVELFKGVTDAHIKLSDGFILVYSITDERSYNHVQRLVYRIQQLKDNPTTPMVIVGNKSDRSYDRSVRGDLVKQLSDSYPFCQYIETSAKLNLNVNHVFNSLIQQVNKRRRSHRISRLTFSNYDHHVPTGKSISHCSIV